MRKRSIIHYLKKMPSKWIWLHTHTDTLSFLQSQNWRKSSILCGHLCILSTGSKKKRKKRINSFTIHMCLTVPGIFFLFSISRFYWLSWIIRFFFSLLHQHNNFSSLICTCRNRYLLPIWIKWQYFFFRCFGLLLTCDFRPTSSR